MLCYTTTNIISYINISYAQPDKDNNLITNVWACLEFVG